LPETYEKQTNWGTSTNTNPQLVKKGHSFKGKKRAKTGKKTTGKINQRRA